MKGYENRQMYDLTLLKCQFYEPMTLYKGLNTRAKTRALS